MQNNQPKERQDEILIIDDTPANLELLIDLLSKAGYMVRPASSGRLALDSVAVKVPDLILLDIRMPEMNGFEVCSHLKAQEHSREIPIIFVTAADDSIDKAEGFRLGAVDYITKPFEPTEVLARIKTHLTIRKTQHELENINAQLEERVRRRTAELEAVNKALRVSEERFKNLFNNAEISIWNEDMSEVIRSLEKLRSQGITDLRAYLEKNKNLAWDMASSIKVYHVNEATLQLFKAEAESQLLYNIGSTFGPDAIDVFIDELCAIWNKDKFFRSEASFKTLDGTPFIAIITFHIPTEAENFKSIPVSIIDITERKKAEEDLSNLRNYLSNIINSMPSELIGIDAAGHITLWNKTVEERSGVPAESAYGKKLSEIFPRMGAEMGKIIESIHTKEIKHERSKARVSEEETKYEDITVYPLITNGVNGAVIRIDDVTDKVRLEEIMVQSEKMLSVGGLAAGMAHEINNPLAGIIQTAYVLENRLGKGDVIPANLKAAEEAGTTMESIHTFMISRGILTMIDTISQSGRRVAEIVENMLSFARKSEDRKSSHSLAELVDKILELAATDYDLKKSYDFKLIEIKKEYEDNIPLVPCGKGQIQQVLLNILRNGAQAMQSGGTKKPLFTIRLKYDKKRSMVSIEIEDNGPGMDDATRKRIFEPFFTTKGVGIGTGLGLSVSYFIITENHGGELSVQSPPGKGAKFIISLPVEKDKKS